jgi:hypothetical protein
MSMVSFVHCNATVTTLVGTSSLWYLHRNLHSISFVAIPMATSLILLMMILHDPLSIPYIFFISSMRAFSFVLSSRYYMGLFPIDGRPVMNAMSSTLMEIGSSIHKNPPWRTSINYLMQLFTYFPLPKWGILTRFRIPMFSRLATHYFGCIMGSPNGPVLCYPCILVAIVLGIFWCRPHRGLSILAFPCIQIGLAWPAPPLE